MNLIHIYLMLQLTKHFVGSQDTNRNALEPANSTTYEESDILLCFAPALKP